MVRQRWRDRGSGGERVVGARKTRTNASDLAKGKKRVDFYGVEKTLLNETRSSFSLNQHPASAVMGGEGRKGLKLRREDVRGEAE